MDPHVGCAAKQSLAERRSQRERWERAELVGTDIGLFQYRP